MLAERFGVSLRKAQRYVRLAGHDVIDQLDPANMDLLAALDLRELSKMAGQARLAGDDIKAMKMIKAHMAALAQWRRATVAKPQRITLPTSLTRAPLPF